MAVDEKELDFHLCSDCVYASDSAVQSSYRKCLRAIVDAGTGGFAYCTCINKCGKCDYWVKRGPSVKTKPWIVRVFHSFCSKVREALV